MNHADTHRHPRRGAHPKVVEAPVRQQGPKLRMRSETARPCPKSPPEGYRLVDDAHHQIGARDMVFIGGLRSYWMPARRAGEAGSVRRDSVAMAVAVLVS